ncbi:MAG: tripartite tricarboxylate transporter substrate binding protein [Xylophilus ampelinus]
MHPATARPGAGRAARHPTRRGVLAALAAGALPAASAAAADGAWPARPVRIVVPYPPGAINDVLARLVAERLGPALGQPVLVENKAGGNTVIGTQAVAAAPPDGLTLLQMPAAHAINAALVPRLPYDPVRGFECITLAARAPFLLVAGSGLPWRSVGDLVAAAKERPGSHTFASSGNGGNAHLMGELLNHLAGIRLLHVPYKGTAAAINDVIGGQVDCTFSTYAGAAPALRAGRVRVLGVTSARRAEAFPEIPAIAEAGYPGYDVQGWWGFAAPAGTPRPVVDRLNREINRAVQAPALRARLAGDAVETQGTTPEAFAAHLAAEIALWTRLVRQAGITAG